MNFDNVSSAYIHGMHDVAIAFKWLGEMIRGRGRRQQRAEQELRMFLIRPEPGSGARSAKMANRKQRRAGVHFRPVVGYLGVQNEVSHADALGHLKCMNHERQLEYLERQAAEAEVYVDFGGDPYPKGGPASLAT